jgi:ribosomal-protein-alanine N-acetyltransferase
LLEGKRVNLRVMEKEDLPLVAEYENNPEFWGELAVYPLLQKSKVDLEKEYDKRPPEENWFFIEKKDGTRIGAIFHFLEGRQLEIGYALIQSERGKGYCTEAVKIMIDYLFLSKEITRIQAHTDVKNVVSQKILEKTEFKKEGTIRKYAFGSGQWRDALLYSILREEWKGPKILTKTAEKREYSDKRRKR